MMRIIYTKVQNCSLPYSEKIWRGFYLAQCKNEIFGVDLIQSRQICFKFGADLIWRSEKNIKFSADLIWHNQRIFDKFIKKYKQFKNLKQEQYQIF